jgi:ubiquinone/menaquinone biosynthesis C-methylase UbiE
MDVACGTGTVARRLLKGSNGEIDLVLLGTRLEDAKQVPRYLAQRLIGCMKDLRSSRTAFDFADMCMGYRNP